MCPDLRQPITSSPGNLTILLPGTQILILSAPLLPPLGSGYGLSQSEGLSPRVNHDLTLLYPVLMLNSHWLLLSSHFLPLISSRSGTVSSALYLPSIFYHMVLIIIALLMIIVILIIFDTLFF